jgi:hypothetical protein
MECGSWCVYYVSKGVSGACKNCSAYHDDTEHKSTFGGVNPFELAKLLAQKREMDRRKLIPQLSDCPKCRKHALFYNINDDSFSCLAIECKYTVTSGALEYKAIVIKFTV